MLCGQCKSVRYCCKEHQISHWKTTHKYKCNKGKDKDTLSRNHADTNPISEKDIQAVFNMNDDHGNYKRNGNFFANMHHRKISKALRRQKQLLRAKDQI